MQAKIRQEAMNSQPLGGASMGGRGGFSGYGMDMGYRYGGGSGDGCLGFGPGLFGASMQPINCGDCGDGGHDREDSSITVTVKSSIGGGREDDLLGGVVCKGGHGHGSELQRGKRLGSVLRSSCLSSSSCQSHFVVFLAGGEVIVGEESAGGSGVKGWSSGIDGGIGCTSVAPEVARLRHRGQQQRRQLAGCNNGDHGCRRKATRFSYFLIA
jgi:hypothetical protein